VHFIGQETWLHGLSFADVLGNGRRQLVVSPLNKTVAAGVRLMAFEIPQSPQTERWAPTILDQTLDRMHNHTHLAWNDDDIDTRIIHPLANKYASESVLGSPQEMLHLAWAGW